VYDLMKRLFTICLICVLIGLAWTIGGCSTIEPYADKAVEAAKTAHDKQIETGELLLCGSSLRAFLARYADDPVKFRAALAICGYERYFNLVTGDLK